MLDALASFSKLHAFQPAKKIFLKTLMPSTNGPGPNLTQELKFFGIANPERARSRLKLIKIIQETRARNDRNDGWCVKSK